MFIFMGNYSENFKRYWELHSRHWHIPQLLLAKTLSDAQIFPIYEGDPLSPPEGEAAQGVRPFDPHVNQRF